MHKKHTLFVIGLLSLCSLFIVISCFKSEEALTAYVGNNKTFQKTTFNDLKNDNRFSALLQDLHMVIDEVSGEISGEIVENRSDEDPIIIETGEVSVCEDSGDGYFSYTFPVSNSPAGFVENLVVESGDQGVQIFLIKYEISKKNLYKMVNQQLQQSLYVPFSLESVDPSRVRPRSCQNITIMHCISCSESPQHMCEESHKCRCDGSWCNPPYFILTTEQHCDGDDDNDSGITIYTHDDNNYNPTGGGGGQGPSTGSGNDGSGTELLMNLEDWYDIRMNNMISKYHLDMTESEFKSNVPSSCMIANSSYESFETCAKPYLNKNDHVDPWPMMWNKTFSCLFQEFMNGNNSVYNATIKGFDNMQNITLKFNSCEHDIAAGCGEYTDPTISPSGFINIYLDPNSSPLVMAETILHEGIHASILAYFEDTDNLSGIDLDNTVRLLQLYKHYNNFANFSDHAYIGEFYLEKIGHELWKLDNKKYPKEQYYGLTYEGLEHYLTIMNYSSLIDSYSQYKQYNSKIKSNSKLCD